MFSMCSIWVWSSASHVLLSIVKHNPRDPRALLRYPGQNKIWRKNGIFHPCVELPIWLTENHQQGLQAACTICEFNVILKSMEVVLPFFLHDCNMSYLWNFWPLNEMIQTVLKLLPSFKSPTAAICCWLGSNEKIWECHIWSWWQ